MPNRPTPRPPLTQFARILLTLGSGESPWLIVAFVLGLIALGVASNFVYSWVVAPESVDGPAFGRVVIAVGVIIVLAYGIYQFDFRRAWRTADIQTDFDEDDVADAHAGLIWLLSPGSIELPLFVIQHHTRHQPGEPLRMGWMLVTREAEETYQRLVARLPELGITAQLHRVPLTAETIEATYQAVDKIYRHEAVQEGLRPDQIISDLTGGLKPMTAGMVVACLPFRRALEYVQSQRDPATGQYIPNTQKVVRVGVQVNRR